MQPTKLLLLLGGNYHDFEGFAAAFKRFFTEDKVEIETTYDGDALLHLTENGIDLVAIYTCFGGSNQDGHVAEDLNANQIDVLVKWVQAGGKLLGVHSATVMAESNIAMRRLLGARFLSHPPQFNFTVYPLSREHPITQGIGAFAIHDEFYMHACNEDIEIQMVALDRGVAHPMVWTRKEGRGRVVYLAPGHGPRVWEAPSYRHLARQAVAWLNDSRSNY